MLPFFLLPPQASALSTGKSPAEGEERTRTLSVYTPPHIFGPFRAFVFLRWICTYVFTHLPYTPPPGRKDASRVPERDGVRESRAPGMTKKIRILRKKCREVGLFLENELNILGNQKRIFIPMAFFSNGLH